MFSPKFDLLVIFSLLSTISSCMSSGSRSRLAAEPDVAGAFYVKIGEPLSHNQSYKLIIAGPPSVKKVAVCRNSQSKPADCASAKDATILTAEKNPPRDTSTSSFILEDASLVLHGQLRLDIAASEPNDGQVQASRIRFRPVGAAGNEPNLSQTNPGSTSASGGSGGQTGIIVDKQTISFENLSTQYRIKAPASNSPQLAHPLVVFLHGDGGSNFGPQSLDARIVRPTGAFGQDRPTIDQADFEGKADAASLWNNVVFLSVLSPSMNSIYFTWNTSLAESLKDKHVALLDHLLSEVIFKKYNIDKQRIFWVGQSGGANFVSNTLVPNLGNKYPGGAIMLCGGEPPRSSLNASFSQDFLRRYKLHFQTTNREYAELLTGIDKGVQKYRRILGESSVGFAKSGEGGHCEFPTKSQPTLLRPVIEKMLKGN